MIQRNRFFTNRPGVRFKEGDRILNRSFERTPCIRHSVPRWVVLLSAIAVAHWTSGAAWATNLNVSVTSGGLNTVTVDTSSPVNYEITGVLSDGLNEGLALFLLDVSFSGGPLSPASTPTTMPMLNFVRPDGMTNPLGYGGTMMGGVLVQVGGSQNTIKNVMANAAFPIGTVMTDVASPGNPVVLVTGSLTAPATEGTYVLSVSNIAASVIREGEDGMGVFWAVDLAGSGTVNGLTINAVVPDSDDPTMTASGGRYLAIDPGIIPDAVGLRITPVCPGSTPKYVGVPSGVHNIARLVDNPLDAAFLTPAQWGNPVNLTGLGVIPSTMYDLEADRGTLGSPQLLPPVSATTWIWGNTDNSGIVELADILCMLDGYAAIFTSCSLTATDLAGNDPDQIVELTDILAELDAYTGSGYPGPSPCP